MTCPNASTSVTIPLSGSALVVKYDQACNVLDGTKFQVFNGSNTAFPQLSASTSPAISLSLAGVSLSANGASVGTAGQLTFKFTPNGLTDTISYTVGAPVTSVSSGTSTP